MNLRPAQSYQLALAAPGQQQETDDVGLLHAGPSPAMGVQRLVQPSDLRASQEPRLPGPRVAPNGTGGIRRELAALNGEVQDLEQHIQGTVCACGRGP